MAIALCIVAAVIMLAMIPFILAGVILAISGALTLLVHFLAWLASPLPRIIGAYNRFSHRIGYRIGRCIRRITHR